MKFGIGASLRRKEDPTFITGKGRYLADTVPPDAARAVMVRSQYAHADFEISNADDVRAMPGVLAVITAEDTAHLNPLPSINVPENHDGSKIPVPEFPVLPKSRVRFVGDTLAVVVAETEAQARDAAEALMIDFTPLDVAADLRAAVAAGAPVIHGEAPGNVAFDWHGGNVSAAAEAMKSATQIAEIELVNNRVVTNFMETRGAIGSIEPETGRYVLEVSSQGVHLVIGVLASMVFKQPREKFHIITPDVGGGFGTKYFCYREYALVLIAAEKTGRKVAWIADRSDHFLADYHGRDHITKAKMGFDERGKIVALEVDTLANLGAYMSQLAAFVPTNGSALIAGVYRIPQIGVRVRGIYSNSSPCDAYRGAGRPEAAYVIERLIDKAARDFGIDPAALRKRNYIPPSAMPHTTKVGRTYDSGEFKALHEQAFENADVKGFRTRLREAKKRGKLRGLGHAVYIEACSGGGEERARLSLGRDGVLTIYIGTQSNGQGHHTAYAQLASEALGIDPDKVRVVQGDTDQIAFGAGTGGSRSIPVGGTAVKTGGDKLAEKIRKHAAEKLEASAADIELFEDGARIAGTDRTMSFGELAASSPEPFDITDSRTPEAPTFPNGMHVVEVEVDPETGETDVVKYTVVDDFGVTLNPIMLEGQIHGGIAQGLGQALMERTVYDESGQLVTASLMDYCLPRADDFPDIAFSTRNVPCKTNPLGLKGAGEAGAIGASPAVTNAVVDALHRAYGITHIDMPATPEAVWRAIQAAAR
ncbi:MAG: xanthine dehydrogenase family protein [Rhodobiaceae bacterium]|nr:xanthine dehydrogenase family protein [Rhodobiaceae bacterium]MCC0012549.1 xanthine dehydrogenase family protein [Rhodobiaceae bacterium]MCC0061756.1 xanthine dehydrogenase family protein [Rhodobiaceae bacterium]